MPGRIFPAGAFCSPVREESPPGQTATGSREATTCCHFRSMDRVATLRGRGVAAQEVSAGRRDRGGTGMRHLRESFSFAVNALIRDNGAFLSISSPLAGRCLES